ncbi:hypothetical protein HK101_006974 [Irineochytrium annulatum]|nr:hypothetical protein HK101_006974 [Irineochytrium annulatum]
MHRFTSVDCKPRKIASHSAQPWWAAFVGEGTVDVFAGEKTVAARASFHRDAAQSLVGLWSDTDAQLREGIVHHSPITCLEWSPGGTRLISGDEEGEVVVWKVDSRGKMASICQYRLKGSLRSCIFRKSPVKLENNSGGRVYHADDMGHCSDAGITLPSIRTLSLFETQILAFVTEDLTIIQYQLTEDGKMTMENEMKISSANSAAGAQLVWIENGVLAIASGTSSVRLIDCVNEDNGEITSGGDAIIAKTSTSAHVIYEQTMCCAVHKQTSVLQTGPSVLTIQKEGSDSFEVEVSENVQFISLFGSVLAACDGKNINVYEFSDDLTNVKLLCVIKSESLLASVDNQTLIVAEHQKVDFYNFNGTVKGNVQMGVSDGHVGGLSTAGSFLSLVRPPLEIFTILIALKSTSKGCIKVYDFSRRDPKLVVSTFAK